MHFQWIGEGSRSKVAVSRRGCGRRGSGSSTGVPLSVRFAYKGE